MSSPIPTVITYGDIIQLNPNISPFGALLGVVVDANSTALTINVYTPAADSTATEVLRFVVPHGAYRIVGRAAWFAVTKEDQSATNLLPACSIDPTTDN